QQVGGRAETAQLLAFDLATQPPVGVVSAVAEAGERFARAGQVVEVAAAHGLLDREFRGEGAVGIRRLPLLLLGLDLFAELLAPQAVEAIAQGRPDRVAVALGHASTLRRPDAVVQEFARACVASRLDSRCSALGFPPTASDVLHNRGGPARQRPPGCEKALSRLC